MSRRNIDIDPQTVENLIAEGMTVERAANHLSVHRNTIYHRALSDDAFRRALVNGAARKRGAGRPSERRTVVVTGVPAVVVEFLEGQAYGEDRTLNDLLVDQIMRDGGKMTDEEAGEWADKIGSDTVLYRVYSKAAAG